MDEDLLRIQNIRVQLQSKLDSVQRAVDQQNTRIDYIIKSGFKTTVRSEQPKYEQKKSESVAEDEILETEETEVDTEYYATESSIVSSVMDRDDIVNPVDYTQSRNPSELDTGVEDILKNLNGITASSSKVDRGFVRGKPGQQIMTSAAPSSIVDNTHSSVTEVTERSEAPHVIVSSVSSTNAGSSGSSKTTDNPQSLEDLLMT